MEMHPVTADDGNGNTFYGLTKNPSPDGEEHVGVWVFIDGDNGWGKNHGEIAHINLKKAGNGHFVS